MATLVHDIISDPREFLPFPAPLWRARCSLEQPVPERPYFHARCDTSEKVLVCAPAFAARLGLRSRRNSYFR